MNELAGLGLAGLEVDHELGCNTTDPGEYQRLLELAAAASARSGRDTPRVAS